MTNEAAPPDTTDSLAPPDWPAIAEEIHCPLCSYNLRGLIEPRCPECGYRCEWPDLLDPTRRLHPYLFEHHPERNVNSFVRTVIGALLPRRFWSSLHPVQPSNRRRLMRYWAIGAATAVVSFVLWSAGLTWGLIRQNAPARQLQIRTLNNPAQKQFLKWVLDTYGSIDNYLDSNYPTSVVAVVRQQGFSKEFLVWMGLVVGWPWIVFLGSLLFEMTLRRSRLNRDHLLRCSLYTFDALTWIMPLLIVSYLVPTLVVSRLFLRVSYLVYPLTMGAVLSTLLIALYRYVIALRHYLRFPHAVATAVSVFGIGFLSALNIALLLARR